VFGGCGGGGLGAGFDIAGKTGTAQVVALGLAGSAFGVVLASLAIRAIPSTLAAAATPEDGEPWRR